jgi:hypothetical protein
MRMPKKSQVRRQRVEVRAEIPEHGVAQQQREAEGAEDLRQHRPLHDVADQREIDDDAERREHQHGERRAEQRPSSQERVRDESYVHAEHDEIAMREVDDVHHAPDQREARGEQRVHRAQQQSADDHLNDNERHRLPCPHRIVLRLSPSGRGRLAAPGEASRSHVRL